ncbi:hypothetical protein [Stappia sp. P2PMeth1]|uniref:hypothetical protein n=1 Tax=Stappia sp. P2PMeth1 TaxID=2003586 RepID=UPI001645FE25|nr:hypothetical protein [Stappia sp. P2PMeth1]
MKLLNMAEPRLVISTFTMQVRVDPSPKFSLPIILTSTLSPPLQAVSASNATTGNVHQLLDILSSRSGLSKKPTDPRRKEIVVSLQQGVRPSE